MVPFFFFRAGFDGPTRYDTLDFHLRGFRRE
jgi:hypothetical protein